VKSYLALEQKLSGSIARPETDEDRVNLLRMLGQPETPDSYDIKVDHGMFDIDPDLNAKLHGLGFTQDQMQAVYDAAADKLVPIVLELSAEFQADREVERLVQEFGGAEKWQEVSRQLPKYWRDKDPAFVAKVTEGFESLYN